MVLTRSSRDIDQKHAIGNYKFTLTPRALCAPDGSILPCTDKSKLIHSFDNFGNTTETHADAQAAVFNMLMILLIQERHLRHHLRCCWCNGARPEDDKETSDNDHSQKSRSSFQRPPYEHDSRIRRNYPGVWHIQGRLIEAENQRETTTRQGPCSIPDCRWYKHQTYINGPLHISRKDESWSNHIHWWGNTGI